MSYVIGLRERNGDPRVVISNTEDHETVINSMDEYYTYFEAEAARLGVGVEDLRVFHSSSMDFPREYTSDPALLALVAEMND